MDIFTINDNEVKTGDVRGIERDKRWACLPAIEWGDDKAVNNVLPKHQPYYSPRGWFEVEDGWLRQILRDPYNRKPDTMDVYLLQNSTHYALGRILNVDAVMASFTIEQFATKVQIDLMSRLIDAKCTLKDVVLLAHNYRENGSIVIPSWNYRIYVNYKDANWGRLAEIKERLPHGSGLNNDWFVEAYSPERYNIAITYEMETAHYYLSWELYCRDDKWVLGEYGGDKLGDENWFLDDLELEIEEALNAI